MVMFDYPGIYSSWMEGQKSIRLGFSKLSILCQQGVNQMQENCMAVLPSRASSIRKRFSRISWRSLELLGCFPNMIWLLLDIEIYLGYRHIWDIKIHLPMKSLLFWGLETTNKIQPGIWSGLRLRYMLVGVLVEVVGVLAHAERLASGFAAN